MIFFDPNEPNCEETVRKWEQMIRKEKKSDIGKIVKVSVNKLEEKDVKSVNGINEDIFFINGLKKGNVVELNVSSILFNFVYIECVSIDY